MYLGLLNDKEKELFLGLAYHLAFADGDYSDAEKSTIAGYCQEMMLEFDKDTIDTIVKPVEHIIDEITKSSNHKVKKIIIFEAIGLAMTDGDYSSSEKELIRKMGESLGVEKEYADNCKKALDEYISFQNKLNDLVIG